MEQNPITRLESVAEGLGALARELEAELGEVPANLVWWRREILAVAADLASPEREA